MILEVSWDSLWTLSFGLSQFHGHGTWLVCEVALIRKEEKVKKKRNKNLELLTMMMTMNPCNDRTAAHDVSDATIASSNHRLRQPVTRISTFPMHASF